MLIAVCSYASVQYIVNFGVIRAVCMLVAIADDMDHHHALYGHLVKKIFGHHTAKFIDFYLFLAIVNHGYKADMSMYNVHLVLRNANGTFPAVV